MTNIKLLGLSLIFFVLSGLHLATNRPVMLKPSQAQADQIIKTDTGPTPTDSQSLSIFVDEDVLNIERQLLTIGQALNAAEINQETLDPAVLEAAF